MWSAEQIAELDERIRKAKYELESMQRRRDRMMQERWCFKKRLREFREYALVRKKLKNTEE